MPDPKDEQTTALEVRKEFGVSSAVMGQLETAGTAAAAKAKAAVESRYVMAMRQPRNLDQVRQDLLNECRRPAFANNKSAIYNKPIGKGVEGLGIRFVEVALRCMRNIMVESEMVFEDELKEVHRITVTDLEANLTYPQDIRVSKTVERAKPADDGSFISVRKNSYGKDVFTVPASDDDLLNKRAALISKAVRTVGLRIIPGDFQDEATDLIKKIRRDKAAEDPAGEQKKIADAFAELRVPVSGLEEYLGHKLSLCSPAEIVQLRGMYGAIKDGEATWAGYMEEKAAEGGDRPPKDDSTTESGRKKPGTKKDAPIDTTGADNDKTKTDAKTTTGTETGTGGEPKMRNLFDGDGVHLGSGIADKVGDMVKIGIIPYKVLSFTENNAIVELIPAVADEQKPAVAAGAAGTETVVQEEKLSEAQVANIKAKLVAMEITTAEFVKAFRVEKIEDIPARLNPIVRGWFGKPGPLEDKDFNFGKP